MKKRLNKVTHFSTDVERHEVRFHKRHLHTTYSRRNNYVEVLWRHKDNQTGPWTIAPDHVHDAAVLYFASRSGYADMSLGEFLEKMLHGQ